MATYKQILNCTIRMEDSTMLINEVENAEIAQREDQVLIQVDHEDKEDTNEVKQVDISYFRWRIQVQNRIKILHYVVAIPENRAHGIGMLNVHSSRGDSLMVVSYLLQNLWTVFFFNGEENEAK